MKRFIHYILITLVALLPLAAQAEGHAEAPAAGAEKKALQADSTKTVQADSMQISLLTCSAGQQVYELYGHFAIRLHDLTPGHESDWVFNYGMFSFRRPHFMWHFMLGETDYSLGVYPYALFYEEYMREGRGIEEQQLDLTPAEKKKLVDALSDNVRPENATYRYNFFYDNCTTRAIRMVEQAVDGTIVWPKADEKKTLRDIVHEFSAVSPWNKFGQDLLLGSEADRPADIQKQMFAPIYAKEFAEKALIRTADGRTRHLVKSTRTILPEALPASAMKPFPITPMWAFGMLLALTLLIEALEIRRKKYYWGFDALLLAAQGLTGCIIAFLFCFSAHPAVGSNWLVALFNPLPLLLLPWFMKDASNRCLNWGMGVQTVMLAITMLAAALAQQDFPAEVYLIVAVLLIRVLTHVRIVKAAKRG